MSFFTQVLGPGGVGGDERQVDLRLHGGGKLDLGSFGRVAQPLQSHFIALALEVQTFIFLEFFDEPVHDALVDVVAAQVGVAIGGLYFDYALADLQDGDVEGSAAEVIDGDGLVLLSVQPVSERRRRRFIDDALHLEAGDFPGVLGGLALGVVEVGGHGDDRFGDLFAEEVFGRGL